MEQAAREHLDYQRLEHREPQALGGNVNTDEAKAIFLVLRERWEEALLKPKRGTPEYIQALDITLSALDEVERLRRSFDVQVGALNESRAKLAKFEAKFNRLRAVNAHHVLTIGTLKGANGQLRAENADQKKRLLFLTTACRGYESMERQLKARLEELDDRPDE